MKKAKPCARAFRANCGKDFFSLLSQRSQSERFCFFHYAFANIFHIFKNSLINRYFCLKLRAARLLQMRFAIKSRFQQLPNLTIRSLLKIKEGLKSATKIVLLILMRVFFKNSLIYCRFRLKLRAMRLLRKHFIAKRLFQQLPNLTIRSLLKIKEGPSESTNASNSIYERGEDRWKAHSAFRECQNHFCVAIKK